MATMTTKQFTALQQKHLYLLTAVLVCGGLLMFAAVEGSLKEWVYNRYPLESGQAEIWLGAAVLAVFLPVHLFVQFRVGPKCPHCRKPLLQTDRPIIIATKNCTKCGHKIINDD